MVQNKPYRKAKLMRYILKVITVLCIWQCFLHLEVYGLGLTPDTQAKSYSPGIVLIPEYQPVSMVPADYIYSFGEIPLEKELSEEDIKKQLEANKVEIQTIRTYPLPTTSMADEIKGTLEYYDYFKCDLGMNIMSPTQQVLKLRFNMVLYADGSANVLNAMVIDGVPKDEIVEKAVASGEITVSISKALKFIPVVGSVMGDVLDAQFKWPFVWGKTVKRLDFSGTGSCTPGWYVEGENINDFNASIIVKKKKDTKSIIATIEAYWWYGKKGYKSDKVEMLIYPLP